MAPMNPRLLRPTSSTLDRDAAVYLNAVAAADQQQLEPAVRKAINDFVVGCKRDGIWDAIKASCILAGARTLSGALVPLKGAAPTNVNFVSGDYDRETGLKGNRSTKYLNSNRANNADPQDNAHMSVWATAVNSINESAGYIGAGGFSAGASQIIRFVENASVSARSRSATLSSGPANSASITGLYGSSRASSSEFVLRVNSTNQTNSVTSEAPTSGSVFVFGRESAGSLTLPTDGRLFFYSIGESLDLALLDARVSALVTAIEAAI
jgi:hypothetical protein